MVGLERGERLVERARHLRHLRQLFGRQVVEVAVDRRRRLDAVLDAVEAGHEHRREREVRVARRVGATELEPLRLRALRVQRDAHRRRAVALRVHEVDRRLVAGHEPLVRVRRRVRERADRRRVLEQAADVPARHVGEAGVALLVEEQRLAALPQRLVHVHARAVVHEDRLRHERHRVARARARRSSRRTCRASACRPSTASLSKRMSISAWPAVPTSWCCTSIGMPTCSSDAHHLRAQVLELVHRRDREVALLVPRLVREVRRCRRARARDPSSTRLRPSRGSSSPRTGSGRSAPSRRCRTRLRDRSTRCRRGRSTSRYASAFCTM